MEPRHFFLKKSEQIFMSQNPALNVLPNTIVPTNIRFLLGSMWAGQSSGFFSGPSGFSGPGLYAFFSRYGDIGIYPAGVDWKPSRRMMFDDLFNRMSPSVQFGIILDLLELPARSLKYGLPSPESIRQLREWVLQQVFQSSPWIEEVSTSDGEITIMLKGGYRMKSRYEDPPQPVCSDLQQENTELCRNLSQHEAKIAELLLAMEQRDGELLALRTAQQKREIEKRVYPPSLRHQIITFLTRKGIISPKKCSSSAVMHPLNENV